MKTFVETISVGRRGGVRRGFSLVEMLIAIGILGLGLIMVACVFPVGADWTRQNADETIAAQVARSAVSLIQTKYTAVDLSTVGNAVQAIPGISQNAVAADMPKLTIYERGFQFGAPSNIDTVSAGTINGTTGTINESGNAKTAQFFWTALIRLTPGTTNRQFDLYILVSKKGDISQTFINTTVNSLNLTTMTPGYDATGVPQYGGGNFGYTRVRATGGNTRDESFVPVVLVGQMGDVPNGSQAVGITSGTVYRNINGGSTAMLVSAGEYVAYVPPADNTKLSPLVYIYQTKLVF